MESNRDPRIQIHANLDEVQKEIERAADERKSEIKQEMKDQKKALKDEVKDLKQEAKDSYKDYKEYKRESDDPVADEKIATAKQASKVVTKSIDVDYENSKDKVDMEADRRMQSIDKMFDDSQEAKDAQQKRAMRDNRMGSVPISRASYEVRDTLITNENREDFLLIHEEREIGPENNNDTRSGNPSMKNENPPFGNKC